MVSHSNGNIIGRTRIHARIYRRELEYFKLLHSGQLVEEQDNRIFSEKTMKLTDSANHYKEIYRLHTLNVQSFFRRHAPERLHVGTLEDPDKWQKLGKFLGVEVTSDYEVHENSSQRHSGTYGAPKRI